jgi:NAD(P)H dehydrogenase (quinone)
VLPTGHGRVAPISRDEVAAAVAAVAAKPNTSRIIYMIRGHRALGFGEIVAAYGETIVRQVRYRPCPIDKYLTWASARLDDPWPYAFSTLYASIAEGRYSQGLQGLHCHYGPRTRELERFPSSSNVRESGRLQSRIAVP